MSKCTDWYPADVKPVYVGYYHLLWAETWKYKEQESLYNYFWDGRQFVLDPVFGLPEPVIESIKAWRGLTELAR